MRDDRASSPGSGAATTTTDLGSATLANYDARTRRLMQVVCLPLSEADGITAADAVTVLDPGTGQDERCQVEPDWLMPYANGVQRCLRLTFPTVVQSGTNRLVRTPNIFRPASSTTPNRVELRNYPYFRPWEDALGVGAFYGIARLATHQRPQLTVWRDVAKDFATDCYRYGTPTELDRSGRVAFRVLRPPANGASASIYEPGAAVAIGANTGTRALTPAEMLQNNWELCGQKSANCGTANDGFMRLGAPGSGTSAFTARAAAYIVDVVGAVDDVMLTRYVQPVFTARSSTPVGSTPTLTWLAEARWVIAFEKIIFGAVRARGSQPVRGVSGASISRLPGQGDEAWVVSDDDPLLYRIRLDTGAKVASVVPDVPPVGDRWSSVHCLSHDGQDLICVMDGRDDALSRTSYCLAYAREEDATKDWEEVSFTFTDLLPQTCTGLAWDPNIGEWLILARRPATADEGDISLWRLSFAGGTAVLDRRTIIDVDHASRVDILEDGRLMIITRDDGIVEPYAYAIGGYWGSPRTQHSLPTATRVACFTRHARPDDALRMVMLGDGRTIFEVEL